MKRNVGVIKFLPMNKWFISDTHFSHASIIKYSYRPFANCDVMNKTLIENWNSLVKETDQVYFLGDFGVANVSELREICSQLRGQKIAIRGNNDRNASWLQRIGFDIVLESAFIKIGCHQVELIHKPSLHKPSHYQLHGHVHETRPSELVDNQLNLSVEVWNYRPVSEKTILHILDLDKKNLDKLIFQKNIN